MSDIRKRVGGKGTTYQVRYPSKSTKSGYAYATFNTRKEAVAFVESGKAQASASPHRSEIESMAQATERWLRICEREGLNGREPITPYTVKNYEYRAAFIKRYEWPKPIQELTPPDIVAFRSWLLKGTVSRVLAGKVIPREQLPKAQTLVPKLDRHARAWRRRNRQDGIPGQSCSRAFGRS
jgi:integrase